MHEGVGAISNILLQNNSNEKLDIFFRYKLCYIFKELSSVIFSVHLTLPNVADCYLKDHLHIFYGYLVLKTKVCWLEP